MVDLRTEDCIKGMCALADGSVDLVVTSPPYDALRTYDGFDGVDLHAVADGLWRVVKDGGVVVWICADQTVGGSETGTCFETALYFKRIGFSLHDTMIWLKDGFTDTGSLRVRYPNVFEYMFVFSKGKPKTFNAIKDRKNLCTGAVIGGRVRQTDGTFRDRPTAGTVIGEYGVRFNVWRQPKDMAHLGHPAPFPLALACDHVRSWSNEGDLVMDPFSGSGTTAVACARLGRDFVGFEISGEYNEMARRRLAGDSPLFCGGETKGGMES